MTFWAIPVLFQSLPCQNVKLNIATWLTLTRVLLLPLAILPITLGWVEGWLISAVVTAVAGLSDFFDGFLARKMNSITAFGAKCDMYSDKLFIGAMLLMLTATGQVDLWIPMVVISRELLILILRTKKSRTGRLVVDKWGKAKTTVSFMAIIWVSLRKDLESGNVLNSLDVHGNLHAVLSLAPVVTLCAVILTVISGLHYFWKYRTEQLCRHPVGTIHAARE